ncbi:MAG TPA: hypothetical protein VF581_13310 [Flavobacterium sp.]|jgi:hypothetical protein
MRARKPALVLYIIACVLAVVAAIIGSESLALISNPVIIPAIYFYYLSAKPVKKDIFVFLFFLLNFIGDTIILLDFRQSTLVIMIPYFLSYLILLRAGIGDVRKIKFDLFAAAIGGFMFIMLLLLTFTLIQLYSFDQQELVVPTYIYGTVLAAYAALGGYCFFATASNLAFYMIMSGLACVVSDVLFTLTSVLLLFPNLRYYDLAIQLLMYYFSVRYFVVRKN